jgi:hypothetical protein
MGHKPTVAVVDNPPPPPTLPPLAPGARLRSIPLAETQRKHLRSPGLSRGMEEPISTPGHYKFGIGCVQT